jgi:hypothetical protein
VRNPANRIDIPWDMGPDLLREARLQLAQCGGAIGHCLTQLNDTQIWWRPQQNMNSAGNLVLHLTGNLGQRFLSDIAGEPFHRDRFGEFTERRTIPRDELLQPFSKVVGDVDALLERTPVEWLGDYRQHEVTAGMMDGTVEGIILRTLMHLAGHTQEIVFITRLQLGERYTFRNPAGVPPSMRRGSGE